MGSKREIKQGEVYMCNFSTDSIDHEQSGVRPCIVVSADVRNQNSYNVFVFPITHANKKDQPCHYTLFKADYPFFNYKKQIVICEEGRSVSKNRLERFLGVILEKDLMEIIACKDYVFIKKGE